MECEGTFAVLANGCIWTFEGMYANWAAILSRHMDCTIYDVTSTTNGGIKGIFIGTLKEDAETFTQTLLHNNYVIHSTVKYAC
jgi:hypothetical protein